MGEKISAIQQKILDFITESIKQQGLPPTMREIGSRLRIPSASTVAYHLKVLEAKGHLKRQSSVSRGIQLAEDPNRLPIIGRVGAGTGIIASEDIEGYLSLDADMSRQKTQCQPFV